MKIIILVALVVTSFISIPAQERVMDRAEFDASVKDDKEQARMWAGKIYRMTVSISTCASDKPESDYSSKTIFEYGPNASFRSIYSSTFGGKTETTEGLKIGKSIYTRKGNGPWKFGEPRKAQIEETVSGLNSQLSPAVSSEIEYRSLGPGERNGEKVNIYLRTERRKETDAATGKTRDTARSSKYWISQEGLIFKSEHYFESFLGDRVSRTSIITEREMAPKIVFVEPQIIPQQ